MKSYFLKGDSEKSKFRGEKEGSTNICYVYILAGTKSDHHRKKTDLNSIFLNSIFKKLFGDLDIRGILSYSLITLIWKVSLYLTTDRFSFLGLQNHCRW